MKISEMKAARAKVLQDADATRAKAKAENREMTADESAAIVAAVADAKTKQSAIEQAEAAVAAEEALDEGIAGLAASNARTVTVVSDMRNRVEDDPKRGFSSLGHFFIQATNLVKRSAIDQPMKIWASISGQSQVAPADGGVLVAPAFSKVIWDKATSSPTSLLGMTDQYTITDGDSLTFPADAETSRAAGSLSGGIAVKEMAEGVQIAASTVKFRGIKLEPAEKAVMLYVTDKLMRNTSALEQYLNTKVSRAIEYYGNTQIVRGVGGNQMRGMIYGATDAPRVQVSKETNQAAASIVYANIVKMWARLLPESEARAVWLVNKDTLPSLAQMTMVVGTGGVPVWLPGTGVAGAPLGTLMGRPVISCSPCSTLGTEGDIILADLGLYLTATKGTIEAATSIHLKFDYQETAFRWVFTLDGQPGLVSSITPEQGSNKQSSIVTLATR